MKSVTTSTSDRDLDRPDITQPYPGIWKITFGQPEEITPVSVRKSGPLENALRGTEKAPPPFPIESLHARRSQRSISVTLPHDPEEGIFGMGLQLKSHLQSGKKRQLRVNSDPVLDQGDSHAPVPFYLSTAGYAVFVDTARYATFFLGTHAPVDKVRERVEQKSSTPPDNPEDIYKGQAFGDRVIVDVPAARGVTIYLFAGPSPYDALRRYILFSGGGCLPPLWALGNWYRAYTGHDAPKVLALAKSMREDKLPFDVMGLEPGWQSKFYPNSFVWSDRFPEPAAFAAELSRQGFRLNLWENAYVHPDAPFADAIRPYCADELSTDGLAPDFLCPEAVEIFARHHDEELVTQGAAGFKLDECDNCDFQSFAWSFPEYARFPSGADGEQMHCLYGVHYQHALDEIFKRHDLRHFDLVRSSGALASPLPYVLYSDLYGHEDFQRGTVNAATSGLLWTPEVRHADSLEDLVRRVQTVVLSPMSLINAWYVPMPPWKQVDRALNAAGEEMAEAAEATRLVREALELRMRILPYLYTAFARYALDGAPVIRPMFLETPNDRRSWLYDRQYMIGSALLAAPITSGETRREVFLPPGLWWSFDGKRSYEGNQILTIDQPALDEIPLFVRDGSIIPLLDVIPPSVPTDALPVRLEVYGTGEAFGELFEDDGVSYAYLRARGFGWTRFERHAGQPIRVQPSTTYTGRWTIVDPAPATAAH